MATVAEIEQQIASLRARLGSLEAAKNAVLQEINALTAEASNLRSAAGRQRAGGDIAGADALRAQAQALDNKAAGLYNSQAFRDIDAAESEIRRLESDLYAAQQKEKANAAQATPPATEERTAKEKAESDKTTPVVDKPAPVQAEGADNKNPPPTAGNSSQTPQPIVQDDKTPVSTTTTQQAANVQGNLSNLDAIKPEPNILDQFASNTWSASVYLLSPAQYTELVRTKKRNVNGYNLLFQSGGAPNNVGGFQGATNPGYQAKTTADGGNQTVAPGVPGSTGPDAGRNPAFSQDFYIDNISFENALPGKQTQTSHMISNLKFTVVEPANITLLDRIYAAVQDMAQTTSAKNKNVNYTATQYLMVIRWYGYDINGNLVAGKKAPDQHGLSDTNAIVEKFIPFLIRKVNWSVSNKLVSYEFDCAPVGQIIGGGTRRGTIPYDVQLTSRTVGDLLAGNVQYYSRAPGSETPGASTTTSGTAQSTGGAGMQGNSERMSGPNTTVGSAMNAGPAPAKADAAATKNILKQGLAGAMTEFSAQLVTNEKVYLQADAYEVIFADGAEDIKNATITLPGSIITQADTPMGTAASNNATQALNPDTNPMDIKARNWSITAGMQMSQVIDLAIRNSSYVYNQALTVYDQETKKEKPNPNAVGKNMQWFNVTMQAVPLEYDEARNDFAYKITYIISKYEIPNFESSYFPIGKFRGIHKRYPYWFTGENTAVLDYTASFNAAYNMTISGGPGQESSDAKLKRRITSNGRDIVKYTYAPRSDQSNKGADGPSNEPGANASEYLYAYADPGGTKLKIIGDPAWIQQGSMCGGTTAKDLSTGPFLPDGTISFDNSQVLFEIAWQRPEDYDLSTGLANPYARAGLTPGQPVQSNFYQATKVANEFRGGKFEQTITGVLYLLTMPETKATNSAATMSAAMAATGGTSATQPVDDSVNRAENAKFARQGNRGSAPVSGSATVAGNGAAVVTPQVPSVQAAMNQAAAAFATGTPLAPSFSLLGTSATATNGFSAVGVTPADTIAPAAYPRAPTGSGVTSITASEINTAIGSVGLPGIFSNAPLPLNTTLQSVRLRTQQIAKDS